MVMSPWSDSCNTVLHITTIRFLDFNIRYYFRVNVIKIQFLLLRFKKINNGFNQVFQYGELSIGIVVPIENYTQGKLATMHDHLKRAQFIDSLGFKALWLRDIPLHVPTFGDAGQTYDPFTYLGYLAGQTEQIALGVSSIALPLHHPIHVAKSAATIDQLSEGRLILGVASGDRYEEYPGTNSDYANRGAAFRDAFEYIRTAQSDYPILKDNAFGNLDGTMDILPKAYGNKIPMLVTGHSQQKIEWISEHSDGWMYYPRNLYMQEYNIEEFRKRIDTSDGITKPFMQPLYLDLMEDDDYIPERIRLGIRTGSNHLIEYLTNLKRLGVNHVALNLRLNQNDIEKTLEKMAEKVLVHFHANDKK